MLSAPGRGDASNTNTRRHRFVMIGYYIATGFSTRCPMLARTYRLSVVQITTFHWRIIGNRLSPLSAHHNLEIHMYSDENLVYAAVHVESVKTNPLYQAHRQRHGVWGQASSLAAISMRRICGATLGYRTNQRVSVSEWVGYCLGACGLLNRATRWWRDASRENPAHDTGFSLC